MRNKVNPKQIPKKLKAWFQGARGKGRSLKSRIPARVRNLDFDFRNIDLKNVSEYSNWFRWGLIVLGVFLAAQLTSGLIGLFLKPELQPVPRRRGGPPITQTPTEDYDLILRRNIFDVEGKIPDPFDQGLLDCMSQAKPSGARVQLLGTIVTSDERHSVALIQEESGNQHVGVKKDDPFGDGKYIAMKVERKKLCFQVRATQDFEYIEIPEDAVAVGLSGPSLENRGGTDGITPLSETEYVVKQNFLEKNLLNLNEVLQTARAVPWVDPSTGKFQGFLVQSMDVGSPFSQLGIRQGDILTGVNDIVLDNAGKGLEAFQQLRNSNNISLDVIRGGHKTTLKFAVK